MICLSHGYIVSKGWILTRRFGADQDHTAVSLLRKLKLSHLDVCKMRIVTSLLKPCCFFKRINNGKVYRRYYLDHICQLNSKGNESLSFLVFFFSHTDMGDADPYSIRHSCRNNNRSFVKYLLQTVIDHFSIDITLFEIWPLNFGEQFSFLIKKSNC